jgi:formaldehyde-activating enzyme involved in methanogenesis
MSRTFVEHVNSLIEDITLFKQRVIGLAQLRAEKNKKLGKSASEGVAQVANILEDTFRDLDDLLNEDVLPAVDNEAEIPEAEVEVVDTAETVVDAVQEEVTEPVAEATEIVDEKPLAVEEAVLEVAENLEQQIDDVSSDNAFNELFLNSQAAVARALGVDIQDSVIDGDNTSE